MRIVLTPRPCIVLETVEMLYAFVNRIPAQELTGDGPYCIPVWSLQQIINDCCSGLSTQKSALQYYFGRVCVQDSTEKNTCLARNIVYDTLDFSSETLEEAREALHKSWRVTKAKRLRPYRIGEYGMAYAIPQETEYTPMLNYIERLSVPQAYQQKLLEAFAGYDDTVDELFDLIAPVAKKLEQHLLPWVQRAMPLIEQWQTCLSQPDVQQYIQKRFRLSTISECYTANFCLHFFNSGGSISCVENDGSLRMYLGVGIPVHEEEQQELEPWEFKALRLLGSPARLRMFQAMMHKPMTSREIAQELEMHLGAVSRDVASLFDARLLIMTHEDNKIRYLANVEAYDTLLQHMAALKTK